MKNEQEKKSYMARLIINILVVVPCKVPCNLQVKGFYEYINLHRMPFRIFCRTTSQVLDLACCRFFSR